MAKRTLPMMVNKLMLSGSAMLVLAFLLFHPVTGFAQQALTDKEQDAADESSATAIATEAQAADSKVPVAEFTVSPKRCVTLRQGQPCFVRITFKWQSSEVIKACMYGVEGRELKCWESASEGSAYLAQSLPNTTEFVLVNDEGVELNRAAVSVAWVYKKKRSKRRWRLF